MGDSTVEDLRAKTQHRAVPTPSFLQSQQIRGVVIAEEEQFPHIAVGVLASEFEVQLHTTAWEDDPRKNRCELVAGDAWISGVDQAAEGPQKFILRQPQTRLQNLKKPAYADFQCGR